MKSLLLIILILCNINASLIIVSNKNINYKELINKDNLELKSTNKNVRCEIFDINLLDKNKYIAKHFIYKNKAICKKDIQKVLLHKIQFDFGNIIIKRDGEVLGENKDYVKIKNYDGSIQKIYKNGQE